MGVILFVLVVTALIAVIFGRAEAQRLLTGVILIVTSFATVFAVGSWPHQSIGQTLIQFFVHSLAWTLVGGAVAFANACLGQIGQSEETRASREFTQSLARSAALAYCISVIVAGAVFIIWTAQQHIASPHTTSSFLHLYINVGTVVIMLRTF